MINLLISISRVSFKERKKRPYFEGAARFPAAFGREEGEPFAAAPLNCAPPHALQCTAHTRFCAGDDELFICEAKRAGVRRSERNVAVVVKRFERGLLPGRRRRKIVVGGRGSVFRGQKFDVVGNDVDKCTFLPRRIFKIAYLNTSCNSNLIAFFYIFRNSISKLTPSSDVKKVSLLFSIARSSSIDRN